MEFSYLITPGCLLAMLMPVDVRSQAFQPRLQLRLLWQYDLAGPSFGGGAYGILGGKPAIVFGTYYSDEHPYALDAQNGTLLWKFKSEGGPFDASLALVDLDGDEKRDVLQGSPDFHGEPVRPGRLYWSLASVKC
jgi:hypothetical protein